MDPLSVNKKITSYMLQAQEYEIQRIADELHEGISQTLYSLYTGLQFIENNIDNDQLKQYTCEMIQLTNRTIEELRWLSTELYPLTLETLGLTAALKSYLKVYTSTFGIMVDIKAFGEEQMLTNDQKIAVFRACQEALNNIAKYADTSDAAITFNWSKFQLDIVVEDFGIGFNLSETLQEKDCLGMASMRQRLELFSGKVSITSTLGKGTKIDISIPINGYPKRKTSANKRVEGGTG
jgi:signal transduction histidine kinase